MPPTPLSQLVPVLQIAIGPVILISGVGLLLLTMTNRFGRISDRAWILSRDLRQQPTVDRDRILQQLRILYRRARLIRLAITLASLSALLAAVLIVALFCVVLFAIELALFLAVVFITCMALVIASLITFTYDIHLSLVALRLELRDVG